MIAYDKAYLWKQFECQNTLFLHCTTLYQLGPSLMNHESWFSCIQCATYSIHTWRKCSPLICFQKEFLVKTLGRENAHTEQCTLFHCTLNSIRNRDGNFIPLPDWGPNNFLHIFLSGTFLFGQLLVEWFPLENSVNKMSVVNFSGVFSENIHSK